MNLNCENDALQNDLGQQARDCRTAASAVGNTTYEGGDFRHDGSAHRICKAQSERTVRDARAHDPSRAHCPARAVEEREFRIPRGERAVQASADTREFLEVREERARQNARSSRSIHGSSRTPYDGGQGNNGGRHHRPSHARDCHSYHRTALLLLLLLQVREPHPRRINGRRLLRPERLRDPKWSTTRLRTAISTCPSTLRSRSSRTTSRLLASRTSSPTPTTASSRKPWTTARKSTSSALHLELSSPWPR